MPPRTKSKAAHEDVQNTYPRLKKTSSRVITDKVVRGSLARMLHVPLDVIIEILCHSHPRDLLSLARTSKTFRDLLMNHKNAFIWRIAREALPGAMPNPRPLLSEPALANLMFFPNCHICDKSPVHQIVWACLKRYCTDCLSPITLGQDEVEARMAAVGLTRVPGNPRRSIDLRTIFNRIGYCTRQPIRLGSGDQYYMPQVAQFELQVYKAGCDDPSLARLYKAQQARVQALNMLSDELSAWSKKGKTLQEEEEEYSRQRRFTDVLKRLKDAGWGPELDFYQSRIRTDIGGPICFFHTDGMSTKLTDEEWTDVHNSLKTYLHKLRRTLVFDRTLAIFDKIEDAVALAAHHSVHADYLDPTWDTVTHAPTAIDIAWMAECAELFADQEDITSFDTHLVDIASRVPKLVALWEDHFKEGLRAHVSTLCPNIPANTDPLELAIAVFGCPKCESPGAPLQGSTESALVLRYPDILSHPCFHQYNRWYPAGWPLPVTHEYQRIVYTRELAMLYPRCPIVPERISMAAAQRAHAALVKANCDPALVLFSDIQAWDKRGGMLLPPNLQAHPSTSDGIPIPNVR